MIEFMIEKYFNEFIEEYNSIKPNEITASNNSICLMYSNVKKVEVDQINKFCEIYNCTYIIQIPYNSLIQFFITKKD